MNLKFAIFSLLFLAFISCRKDEKPFYDECSSEISVSTELRFEKDIKAFAIERLAADSSIGYTKNPLFRPEMSIYILGKLSAIFNAAVDPKSPLYAPIFEYQIHKQFGYYTQLIGVSLESDSLTYQIYLHPESIENPVLRDMLDNKGFVVSHMSAIGPNDFVVLKSEKEYVQQHFVSRLLQEPDIDTAFTGLTLINDYNDITYTWTESYDEFTFIYGMGDCPAGCTEFHYWQIRVDKNCNVTLVDEYGDPLPG
jgi:hypothetical protein